MKNEAIRVSVILSVAKNPVAKRVISSGARNLPYNVPESRTYFYD